MLSITRKGGVRFVQVFGIETRPDWERMAKTLRITASMGTGVTLSPFWNLQTTQSEYQKPASKPASMNEAALTSGLPDDALMPRIAAGDAQAFTELFRRRQGEV